MNAIILEKSSGGTVKATNIVSWLLSYGVSAVTTQELSYLLGIPVNQVRQRLVPLQKRTEIVSPVRGLWIPVPYEYRHWGAPEAILYIDKMMRYLDIDYYLGWMTAAAIQGASHHAPQVFQVATSRTVANRVIGRSNIRFYHRSNVGSLPTFRFKTRTGYVKVSTRAATMLSVASDLRLAAGPDNAANIAIELSDTEESFIDEVAASAALFPISALRRLGWILENFTDVSGLEPWLEISRQSDIALSKLSMYQSYSNKVDKRWSLDINERVEPDV